MSSNDNHLGALLNLESVAKLMRILATDLVVRCKVISATREGSGVLFVKEEEKSRLEVEGSVLDPTPPMQRMVSF